MDYKNDLLLLFYDRLFPHSLFNRWLNCSDFKNREISFTLRGDVYIRFLSFNNYEDFVRLLLQKRPVRLNIGAIYSIEPKYQSSLSSQKYFVPLSKEMMIDIDLTDYDDIRICCTGGRVCEKCWKFMCVACKVIDAALREDFGCQNILWAFSGRRGIHCWVADDRFTKLNKLERSAVAEYLFIVKGGRNMHKKVVLPNNNKIHPFLLRSIKIIDQYFETIVTEQDILGNERLETFLNMFDIINVRNVIKEELNKYETSLERWQAFIRVYTNLLGQKKHIKLSKYLIEIIKLQYAYPRLDINVSKGMEHLLKSPFTVHPVTDKISVPFEVNLVDDFNPVTVPCILSVTNELKSANNKRSLELKRVDPADLNNCEDYKETSLNPFVAVFEKFVENLEKTLKRGA